MITDEVRWGILGCGDVTEVKSGPALQQVDRSSVVAVMRRNGAKAKDYASRHGVANWYDNATALIIDPRVNAIYIATPPSSHAELTALAFEHNRPVFVEKPMARDVAECDTMIAAANKSGQSLIVAYYRRALPRFEKLRALIEDGAIGTPRVVQITQLSPSSSNPAEAWKIDPSVGGGGMFFDSQPHTLDWLQYVFGEAQNIKGLTLRQAGDYPAEDFVAFTGVFGDVAVTGTSAFAVGETREDVTIYGERGSLSMSFFSHTPITLKRDGTSERIEVDDPAHMHQPFIERVVAHLLDGASNPCSGEDARHTNRVLEEIYGNHAT